MPGNGSPQITLPTDTLASPTGIAVDSAGNVYVADTNNNRVLKIQANSGSWTLVGNGLSGPNAVAVDRLGNLFISDAGNQRAVEVLSASGTQIALPLTGLTVPIGIGVDATGDLFVADSANNRVIELASNGVQSTIAAGLTGLSGLTVDAAGDVFVDESIGDQVLEIPVGGGQQVMLPLAGLNSPAGLALDASGNVFIADANNNRIVELQTASVNAGAISVCAGSQSGLSPCSQTLTLNYAVDVNSTFGVPAVLTGGVPGLDYSIAPGGTCTGALIAGSQCVINENSHLSSRAYVAEQCRSLMEVATF